MTKVRVNRGRSTQDTAVSLFEVYNTSHKRLLVLAHDRAEAASIAHAAAHIYYTTTTLFSDQSRGIYEVGGPGPSDLLAYWGTIQTAIEQRLRGTVHFDDEQVSVGNEVVAR